MARTHKLEQYRNIGIMAHIDAAKTRSETTLTERVANELLDAFANKGSAVKKREDTHKMAEANKAFSHYKF